MHPLGFCTRLLGKTLHELPRHISILLVYRATDGWWVSTNRDSKLRLYGVKNGLYRRAVAEVDIPVDIPGDIERMLRLPTEQGHTVPAEQQQRQPTSMHPLGFWTRLLGKTLLTLPQHVTVLMAIHATNGWWVSTNNHDLRMFHIKNGLYRCSAIEIAVSSNSKQIQQLFQQQQPEDDQPGPSEQVVLAEQPQPEDGQPWPSGQAVLAEHQQLQQEQQTDQQPQPEAGQPGPEGPAVLAEPQQLQPETHYSGPTDRFAARAAAAATTNATPASST